MSELLKLKDFVKNCILGCRVQMDYHFGSNQVNEDRAELKAYQNMLREINNMLGEKEDDNT